MRCQLQAPEYATRLNRTNTAQTSFRAQEEETRSSDDLFRKLLDSERALSLKVAANGLEIKNLESRLKETRQELDDKNREEKELRAKDVSSSTWLYL